MSTTTSTPAGWSPQPPDGKGRGAWTVYGGLLRAPRRTSGRGYYRNGQDGEVPVGSHHITGDTSRSARAVHLGVKAVQLLAGMPARERDGWFGPDTHAAVVAAQAHVGVEADGWVGPTTMRAWLQPLVVEVADALSVPVRWLGGILVSESDLDPGAVGFGTPDDQGLAQIRLTVHTSVTPGQAYDPPYAVHWTAAELARNWARWESVARQNIVDPWVVAALAHNSPRNARRLAETGVYPTQQAREYIEGRLPAPDVQPTVGVRRAW